MAFQLRRGTDAQRQTIVFAQGEPVWTVDLLELWIGDGVTAGGVGPYSIGGSGPSGGGSLRKYNQVLTGVRDGVNKVFTSPDNFVAGSTSVYKNTLRKYLANDYNETGPNEITFIEAPEATAALMIEYTEDPSIPI